MKHVIFGTVWIFIILGITLRYQGKITNLNQELDNYKEMEKFYLQHIEFCDTLHEGCFKMTKADAG